CELTARSTHALQPAGCASSRLLKNVVLGLNFSMSAMVMRGAIGCDRRCERGVGYGFASFSALQTDSSRRGQKLGDANEIVGGCSQDEEPFHQVAPAMSGLAQAADGLDPAERLFGPFSLEHADGIAGM